MRYTSDELFLLDNFDNLSKNEMIEIIKYLRNDLKYYKLQRDNTHDNLSNANKLLAIEVQQLKNQIETINGYNKNLSKQLMKPLTLIERIKGKIDINK